jgi:diguanylate cyclase (GGDEF)-like protein
MPTNMPEHTNLEVDRDEMGRGDGLGDSPEAAALRDSTADRRDLAAAERDLNASVRDREAIAEPEEDESPSGPLGDGSEQRSHRDRRLAAADRLDAAMDRRQAADDRVSARDRIAHEDVDPLTGAMRRRAGLAALQRELDQSEKSGGDLVLAFVDTLSLKAINDSRGHSAGDRVLQDITECLVGVQGKSGIVVRLGGGAFVCANGQQTLDQGNLRYGKFLTRLARKSNGAEATLGLALREDGDSLDALIDRADQAMIGHSC